MRPSAAGLDDGPLEQSLGERADQQVVHRHAAGRLAEDRHVVRIATECPDVTLHPPQGRQLVHERIVAEQLPANLAGECRKREETEVAQPIVEADQHHSIAGELRPVVDRRGCSAIDEPAAVDPHHHRQVVCRSAPRAPDVEIQAVLFGTVRSGAPSPGKSTCMQCGP